MTELAEHITTAILPEIPYSQWVLTLPFNLRYVLAWNADLRNAVHRALMRAIDKHDLCRSTLRACRVACGHVWSATVGGWQRTAT
jgi:hypothetical protein